MRRFFGDGRRLTLGYWTARLCLAIFMIATFIPFILMLFMSVKSGILIQTDFWAIPDQLEWGNYAKAGESIVRPILNSLFIGASTIALVLLLVSMAGYAFGKHRFFGKEVLFFLFIGVMMIPSVLMIVPLFSIISRLQLLNSYWALILPYAAGQQLFGILLARTFFSSLPEEMFEAARIEGAGEGYLFAKIALPLSLPILITVGITSFIAVYNDYVWPSLTISGESKMTFTQVVFTISTGGSVDYGLTTAAFVIGAIPLLIITISGLKYYVEGMLQGAVKG